MEALNQAARKIKSSRFFSNIKADRPSGSSLDSSLTPLCSRSLATSKTRACSYLSSSPLLLDGEWCIHRLVMILVKMESLPSTTYKDKQSFNIPVRLCVVNTNTCTLSCNSPGSNTPNLVARPMGLDTTEDTHLQVFALCSNTALLNESDTWFVQVKQLVDGC